MQIFPSLGKEGMIKGSYKLLPVQPALREISRSLNV